MTMMPIGKQCGQVTIEYFILFAVVALLTVAGLTTFDDDVKAAMQAFFQGRAHAIMAGGRS